MKTKRTKAELADKVESLEAQVAELEERLRALRLHRDQLEAELVEARQANEEWRTYAETHAATDTFIAFVATMPRKVVFRALARAVHPDVGGDVATMQALTEAWTAARN